MFQMEHSPKFWNISFNRILLLLFVTENEELLTFLLPFSSILLLIIAFVTIVTIVTEIKIYDRNKICIFYLPFLMG
jgi:hypothetical protein